MIYSNLSKREKHILIITIFIILSALAYNFVLEPIFKKWNALNNEIAVERTKIVKSLRLLNNRDSIIGDYAAYAKSVGNIPKILGYIETKANSLEIKILNIKPRPAFQKGLYKEHIIELQIEGYFENINRFISELIKPPLFIAVKQFDLRAVVRTPHLKGTLILSKITI